MTRPTTGGRFALRSLWLPFLLFLACQVALQVANRSYTSEFARTHDEAGHYVTGLMVRDFVAGLDWTAPMAFAEEYYLHYPKVAMGHWPPIFHLSQGLWTLVFSPSRTSLMILMALLTAAVSLSIHRTLAPHHGFWAGLAGGLLFPLLPLVQANSSVVMGEALLALVAFWAALHFGRYLDTERASWAGWFALFAGVAIMTKPNGLALGLLPPFCLLLTGRYRLLRRLSLWSSALAVLAVCGPWYAYTLEMLRNGPLEQAPQWAYTAAAVPTFSLHLVRALGFGLCAFAVIGVLHRVVLPTRHRALDGTWAALASLVLASLVFHWVIPADFDPRHLILALPPLICFAVAGLVESGQHLPLRQLGARGRFALTGAVAALLFGVETFTVPGEEWRGFGSVAEELLSQQNSAGRVFLVSSDPDGEGALVAEVALRDRRREFFVLRGSKMLAASRWDGTGYQSQFETTEAMWSFLQEAQVDVVVVDRSVPERFEKPHHELLVQTLAETADHWTTVGIFPLVRHGVEHPDAIRLFARADAAGRSGSVTIRVDLTEMLGRYLEGSIPEPAERPR